MRSVFSLFASLPLYVLLFLKHSVHAVWVEITYVPYFHIKKTFLFVYAGCCIPVDCVWFNSDKLPGGLS